MLTKAWKTFDATMIALIKTAAKLNLVYFLNFSPFSSASKALNLGAKAKITPKSNTTAQNTTSAQK